MPFDANTLEPLDPADKTPVSVFQKIKRLQIAPEIHPQSVQREIDDPRAPASTRSGMQGIYTWAANLKPREELHLSGLKSLLRGTAASARHDANADPVSEVGKHGRRYYLTHDKRLLERRTRLPGSLGLD